MISLFKGEVLSDEEAEKRVLRNEDHYFIVQLDGQILDSKHVDCFAKYANDAEGISKSTFENNAKISLDEDNNICIIATCMIKAETEIFCCYGKDYWIKHG